MRISDWSSDVCSSDLALIAAAAAAAGIRQAGRFGVNGHEPAVDFLAVRGHLRDVIAAIAPPASVERVSSSGVTVIQQSDRFTGPRAVRTEHITGHAPRPGVGIGLGECREKRWKVW